MIQKKALITGITGQDGSYLSELLVEKGYKIYGLVRSSVREVDSVIDALERQNKINIIAGDIRDLESVKLALDISEPDEIYNLASQSHVADSFSLQSETFAVNHRAATQLVEAALEQNDAVRIYQASSSEMFGDTTSPQTELSSFNPVTPYGMSKLMAYRECVLDNREKRNSFICSGILYNHESPRRGKGFVTRKITSSLAQIKLGQLDCLEVGNIDSKRDWGYAKDYVYAMWLMMQQSQPDDFIIASGILHSVKELINTAAEALSITLSWQGEGLETYALDHKGKIIVKINPKFYRPVDANNLVGDSTKARTILGWVPTTNFKELVTMMAKNDLEISSKTYA